MVESVDDSVGRIVKKLDELKIAERTVLVFFSDNGGLSFTGSTTHAGHVQRPACGRARATCTRAASGCR